MACAPILGLEIKTGGRQGTAGAAGARRARSRTVHHGRVRARARRVDGGPGLQSYSFSFLSRPNGDIVIVIALFSFVHSYFVQTRMIIVSDQWSGVWGLMSCVFIQCRIEASELGGFHAKLRNDIGFRPRGVPSTEYLLGGRPR